MPSYTRRFLCFIGFHSWEFKDTASLPGLATLARCKNPWCRHRRWFLVNYDPRKPW